MNMKASYGDEPGLYDAGHKSWGPKNIPKVTPPVPVDPQDKQWNETGSWTDEDGWIHHTPPGKETAEASINRIELEIREKKLKDRERDLVEKDKNSAEDLKDKKVALDNLRADLLNKQALLDEKLKKLGIAEEMLDSMEIEDTDE